MLIEFKVSNYRSIKSSQALSLVAGPGNELEGNTCLADFEANIRLLNSAVIYGPNAGGKSNLIKALSFMRSFILNSAKESQQGEQIEVESFLFDSESRHQPTEFTVTFSKNNIRYQYGFVVDNARIFEEWLYAYPVGRLQQWFSRQYNKEKDTYEWKFSPNHFKGEKHSWQALTRSNALFLSTAVLLNSEQLAPIYEWFQKDIYILPAGAEARINNSVEQIKTDLGKEKIINYLKMADPSIVGLTLKFETFSEEKLSKKIPQELKELIKKEFVNKEIANIELSHGNDILLALQQESDGTNKLFCLAGLWIDVLENGKVLIIDELNNSLHPLLVKFLIGLFSNPKVNKNRAQLIFSTHDTSLLDAELFRRDQIWFVEKDQNNSTQLYPLLDFSPRKQEALGKGYLQGRYGALPYIGEWRF